MNFKGFIIAGLLAFALAFSAFAQVLPGTSYNYLPISSPTLTIDVGNTATGGTQTLTVQYGYASIGNGIVVYPLATGTVGQTMTVGAGTNADTLTVTAVSCATPAVYDSCTVSGTGLAHSHGRGELIVAPTVGPPQVFEGICTGTATASQTLGLYGLGQRAAVACTQTVFALGITQPLPGIIRYLGVATTVAGTTASSGVFTVEKNGSDTTVTCTVGTGTSCSDSSHLVPFAAGDIISVKFTTQSAETLAGVTATVVTY